MGRYDDIIDMEYRGVRSRRPMPVESRASQFAAFAALNGHGEAIEETARFTDQRIELSPDDQDELARRINFALEHNTGAKVYTFVYFVADETKSGGRYVTRKAVIRKRDLTENRLLFTDGSSIPITDIISIR